MPGPGAYKPKNDLSVNGDYVLSKNHSNGTRGFGKANRQTFVE